MQSGSESERFDAALPAEAPSVPASLGGPVTETSSSLSANSPVAVSVALPPTPAAIHRDDTVPQSQPPEATHLKHSPPSTPTQRTAVAAHIEPSSATGSHVPEADDSSGAGGTGLPMVAPGSARSSTDSAFNEDFVGAVVSPPPEASADIHPHPSRAGSGSGSVTSGSVTSGGGCPPSHCGPYGHGPQAQAGGESFLNLFVTKLPRGVQDGDLHATFLPLGARSSTVMLDAKTGASKGFGFVLFDSEVQGRAAHELVNARTVVMCGVPVQLSVFPSKHDPRTAIDPSPSLYVRNVPMAVPKAEVEAMLGQFGAVAFCAMREEPDGLPVWVILVEYDCQRCADNALSCLRHNTTLYPLHSMPVIAKYAKAMARRRSLNSRKRVLAVRSCPYRNGSAPAQVALVTSAAAPNRRPPSGTISSPHNGTPPALLSPVDPAHPQWPATSRAPPPAFPLALSPPSFAPPTAPSSLLPYGQMAHPPSGANPTTGGAAPVLFGALQPMSMTFPPNAAAHSTPQPLYAFAMPPFNGMTAQGHNGGGMGTALTSAHLHYAAPPPPAAHGQSGLFGAHHPAQGALPQHLRSHHPLQSAAVFTPPPPPPLWQTTAAAQPMMMMPPPQYHQQFHPQPFSSPQQPQAQLHHQPQHRQPQQPEHGQNIYYYQ